MPDPVCRLYLATPPDIDPAAFAPLLSEALDAGDVAAVLLRFGNADDAAAQRAVETLRPIVQDRGVAFVLDDHPGLAAASACDGVQIGGDEALYAPARKTAGDDAIVGVACGDSRHAAMVAAEKGADYVAFEAAETAALAELVQWWSEMMEAPCVAVCDATPEGCGPLVTAGADFLCVGDAVWSHPGGPGAAVKAFNSAIVDALAA